ncbi:MAG TPA: FtsX-like permease family protein, partial [Vicinamibacterales bacterium]|nr:FtsX-like permease family protein [Vicinamibacterales bacterium]
SAATLLFPGENPLDKQLRPAAGANQPWFTVVGVVEDVLIDDLRRKSPEPMVYLPGVSPSPAYVLKSARADQLEPEVRAIIREMIPESPMYRVFTMERLAAKAMASLSFTMLMVGLAATLALVLGAVGLYGVLSYRAMRRAPEIGLRMALGAEAKTVRRMFIWQGARVALLGVAVGALAAAALTKYIQTLLFGVGRFDVPAFAGMSAVMIAVALLASYVPARRASRVDPVVALRME